MHARDEFRRRNLVVVLLVRVVVLLQIVVRRVVAQVRGVRVRRQAVVVQRLVAAVLRVRVVVRVAVVAQVFGQLGIERLLNQQLGQLLEQAVLADQVFRLLVVGQQAGQQFCTPSGETTT